MHYGPRKYGTEYCNGLGYKQGTMKCNETNEHRITLFI